MTNIIEKLCIVENGPWWDLLSPEARDYSRKYWADVLDTIEAADYKVVTKQQHAAWIQRDYHEAMSAAFQAGKK